MSNPWKSFETRRSQVDEVQAETSLVMWKHKNFARPHGITQIVCSTSTTTKPKIKQENKSKTPKQKPKKQPTSKNKNNAKQTSKQTKKQANKKKNKERKKQTITEAWCQLLSRGLTRLTYQTQITVSCVYMFQKCYIQGISNESTMVPVQVLCSWKVISADGLPLPLR